ncbi:unnamed protein product [Litomosoides sigmodontis]|uniref:Uncharacterized protein n=1 Tax=Litomosoides sigmodontis TaxID=42156 RepID=A0A3P6UYD0_LITSI|nr:unnamed protein product [Litomosoides sigmodontis]
MTRRNGCEWSLLRSDPFLLQRALTSLTSESDGDRAWGVPDSFGIRRGVKHSRHLRSHCAASAIYAANGEGEIKESAKHNGCEEDGRRR